jgi:hypothetical protein
MKLTPQQKKAVAEWLAQGASIAEVQKRLRDEFQVSLTYMDTRFLIDDLGLAIKASAPVKPPAGAESEAKKNSPAPSAQRGAEAVDAEAELLDDSDEFADELEGDVAEDAAPDEPPGKGGGQVTVEVDRLTRPGTVVSGTVKFSDGNSGKWALDQYGRLVFEGATPSYRPSQADLQAFQRELSRQLQRHGY